MYTLNVYIGSKPLFYKAEGRMSHSVTTAIDDAE